MHDSYKAFFQTKLRIQPTFIATTASDFKVMPGGFCGLQQASSFTTEIYSTAHTISTYSTGPMIEFVSGEEKPNKYPIE